MEDRRYTVYMHIFPNEKKYIGITRQDPKKRWKNGKRYANSNYIKNAINKYGWDNVDHIILFTQLDRIEAERKEIELISFYQSNNIKFGYNIANGGRTVGNVSNRTKQILSQQRMGSKNPMYGKKGSLSHHAIKVNQYGLNGKYIKTWKCAKLAEYEKIASNSKIIACCKGKRKSASGYQWKYYNGCITDIEPYEKHSPIKDKNPMYGKKSNKRKIVCQYSKDGVYIKSYESLTKAGEESKVSFKDISSCCLGKYKTAGGFIWRYAS